MRYFVASARRGGAWRCMAAPAAGAAAPAARRRRTGAAAGHGLRSADPSPRALPPAGLGPGRPVRSRPASRRRATRRSSSRRPTCITSSSEAEPPVAGRLGAVRRGERADRSATTSSACGHQLPRQPVDRDVTDYTFSNGVVGKIVIYNMEERQRVKIVDYVGSKKVEATKIDEKLKEANAADSPRHLHRSRRWSARSRASSATC